MNAWSIVVYQHFRQPACAIYCRYTRVYMLLLAMLVAVIPLRATGQLPVMDDAGDQAALQLGQRVEAVRAAIQHPEAPGSLEAIIELGHDQRYYVMVRGWLAWQLQGDLSILEASGGQSHARITRRIELIQEAIRAIDLE